MSTSMTFTMGQIAGDAIQITTEYSTFNSRDGKVPTFRNIPPAQHHLRAGETAVRMTGLADRALQNINLERVPSPPTRDCTAPR